MPKKSLKESHIDNKSHVIMNNASKGKLKSDYQKTIKP